MVRVRRTDFFSCILLVLTKTYIIQNKETLGTIPTFILCRLDPDRFLIYRTSPSLCNVFLVSRGNGLRFVPKFHILSRCDNKMTCWKSPGVIHIVLRNILLSFGLAILVREFLHAWNIFSFVKYYDINIKKILRYKSSLHDHSILSSPQKIRTDHQPRHHRQRPPPMLKMTRHLQHLTKAKESKIAGWILSLLWSGGGPNY